MNASGVVRQTLGSIQFPATKGNNTRQPDHLKVAQAEMENALEQAKQYAQAGLEKATELGQSGLEKATELGHSGVEKATALGQQAIDLVKEQIAEHTSSAPSQGITSKASTGPLSPTEEKKLEDALANRPTPKELQEKNILKDSKVAPSLQAKQEELKQQQLKDSLDSKIAMRPTPEDLTEKNILLENPSSKVDGSIAAGVAALEKARVESTIEAALETRPAPEELIQEGILKKSDNPLKP